MRLSLTNVARIAFWMALVFAITMALLPRPPEVAPEVGDKVMHMLAFATLAGLARIGFPSASDWRILERLSFVGALIEVFQTIPSLHRDGDALDWVADTAAVAAVLIALVLWRWLSVHRSSRGS